MSSESIKAPAVSATPAVTAKTENLGDAPVKEAGAIGLGAEAGPDVEGVDDKKKKADRPETAVKGSKAPLISLFDILDEIGRGLTGGDGMDAIRERHEGAERREAEGLKAFLDRNNGVGMNTVGSYAGAYLPGMAARAAEIKAGGDPLSPASSHGPVQSGMDPLIPSGTHHIAGVEKMTMNPDGSSTVKGQAGQVVMARQLLASNPVKLGVGVSLLDNTGSGLMASPVAKAAKPLSLAGGGAPKGPKSLN